MNCMKYTSMCRYSFLPLILLQQPAVSRFVCNERNRWRVIVLEQQEQTMKGEAARR